jgi:hypothetical protein
MYIYFNVQHCTFKTAMPVINISSTLTTTGFRINIWKREYDVYRKKKAAL